MNTFRLLAAAALLAAPVSLHAQQASQVRSGIAMSFGLGAGSNGYTCANCGSGRRNGGSVFLSIGGTVSPSVVLAGELSGWSREQDGTSYTTAFIGPTAQWYPNVDAGFFLKAGAGIGSVRLKDNTVFSQDELLSNGFGYQVGMGYDLPITHSFALTPYVGYMGMSGSSATVNGQSVNEKLDANFWHYGLGLTWH
jgi:hypothetical protein